MLSWFLHGAPLPLRGRLTEICGSEGSGRTTMAYINIELSKFSFSLQAVADILLRDPDARILYVGIMMYRFQSS